MRCQENEGRRGFHPDALEKSSNNGKSIVISAWPAQDRRLSLGGFTAQRDQAAAREEAASDERRGKSLAELVPNIPDQRLLLETDAPYLLPRDLPEPPPKKRRNEPSLLPWIGQRVAQLRGQQTEEVAAITYANAVNLFR